jgi:hypothetical protein
MARPRPVSVRRPAPAEAARPPARPTVAVRRVVGAGERLGDPEVGHQHVVAVDEHVARLHVAVHDAAPVRVGERARHLAHDARDLAARQRAVAREAARAATRPR